MIFLNREPGAPLEHCPDQASDGNNPLFCY
uniref:Uncharacterized protein n=1 Tax=Siphoviridae sp. ctevH2 TaxID=2825593 RepID=A0A8S5UAX9_9CAUD|nr:MAG TPA: hypothetical protein [Siphoviridae sp. ctevH2]